MPRLSRSYQLGLVLVVGLVCIAGCIAPSQLPLRTATPAPDLNGAAATSPTPTLAAVMGSVPPVVLAHTPEVGGEIATDGVLIWEFDQAMDPEAFSAGLSLYPDVEGEFTWSDDDRTVTFKPANLAAATRYAVTLGPPAQSSRGVSLSGELTYGFTTLSPLLVTKVTPTDGAVDLRADAPILMAFNRAMVPAACVKQAASSDGACPEIPLTFEPALRVTGQWVERSVYRVLPLDSLRAGTRYVITLDDDVTSLDGAALGQAFAWSFEVAVPRLTEVGPDKGAVGVPLDADIRLRFSTPMDREISGGAFSLTSAEGMPISGTIGWGDNGALLVFTPTMRLEADAAYVVQIGPRARAVGSTPLSDPGAWRFRTVPYPALLSSEPGDGAVDVPVDGPVHLAFTGDIDEATLGQGVSISPTVDAASVYTTYDATSGVYTMLWDRPPRTLACVSLGTEIADVYGNALADALPLCFETGDLPPLFGPRVASGVVTLGAQRPADLAFAARNVESVSFTLSDADVATALGSDAGDGDVLRTWTSSYDLTPNVTDAVTISLTRSGSALPPGVYALSWRADGAGEASGSVAIVVTDRHTMVKMMPDEALVWLTDLETGTPVTRTAVELVNREGMLLAGSTTDLDGIARLPIPEPANPGQRVAVVSGEQGEAGFAMVAAAWDDRLGNVTGLADADMTPSAPYRLFLETDRDVYGTGDSVRYAGVLREDEGGAYQLPTGGLKLMLTVRDGETLTPVVTDTVEVPGSGLFDGTLAWDGGASPGSYVLEVALPSDGEFPALPGPHLLASRSIRIVETSTPRYDVRAAPEADEVYEGERARVQVSVIDALGEPGRGVTLAWSARAMPSEDTSGVSGSSQPMPEWYWGWSGMSTGSHAVASGQGQTDVEGQYTIEIPTALSSSQGGMPASDERWVFEITALGETGHQGEAYAALVVRQSEIALTLSPRSAVVGARDRAVVEVSAADGDGRPVSGLDIDLRFARRVWRQDEAGQWLSHDELLTDQVAATDETGRATGAFTVPDSGIYVVTGVLRDDSGRLREAETLLWASGDDWQSWSDHLGALLDVVPDKEVYLPGDTAQILVATPFDGPYEVLVTVEQDGLVASQRYSFDHPNPVLEVPIEATYAPNVYVSVVVVRPATVDSAPAAYMGYARLAVDPGDHLIHVTISSDKLAYEPGDDADLTITTIGVGGRPVPATVGLVIVPTADGWPASDRTAVTDAFYGDRVLRTLTGDSLLVADDPAPGWTRAAAAGSRVLAQSYVAPSTSRIPGMAEGESGGGVTSYRGRPLYWAPSVRTDEMGRAVVTVAIPDELGSWHVRAWAVTDATEVGYAEAALTVTSPLFVQPLDPAFVVEGDAIELAALVHNSTEEALGVDVRLDVVSGLQALRPVEQHVDIAAGAEERVTWPVRVIAGDAADVQLGYSAESGSHMDTAALDLPVHRFYWPAAVTTAGALDAASSQVAAIVNPSDAGDASRLAVRVQPSLLSALTVADDSAAPGGQETTDYWVNHLLSVLAADVATEVLSNGGSAPSESGANGTSLERDLAQLYLRQGDDGGWRWYGGGSDLQVTSYAIYGLLRCRAAGIDVRSHVVEAGLHYIQGAAARDVVAGTRPSSTALGLYTLSLAGRAWPPGAVASLYGQRDALGIAGRAYLALALGGVDPSDPRVGTLLDDLRAKAQVSSAGAHWEASDSGTWTMDIQATAAVVVALTQLAPEDPLLPQAVAWSRRAAVERAAAYTYEAAWLRTALAEYAGLVGEGAQPYEWLVMLNSRPILDSTGPQADGGSEMVSYTASSQVAQSLLRSGVNVLQIVRDAGAGQLHYAAALRRVLRTTEAAEGVYRGMLITRRYCQSAAAGEGSASFSDVLAPGAFACTPVGTVAVGDRVRVQLLLSVPTTRYYVRLDDPSPAGLQPAARDAAAMTFDTGVAVGAVCLDPVACTTATVLSQESPVRMVARPDGFRLYAGALAPGTYVITYDLQAIVPGVYHALPAEVTEVYSPEVWGFSGVDSIEVLAVNR